MKLVLVLVAVAACTTERGELYQRPATEGGAKVAVIELGWDSIEDQNPLHPPVVDNLNPRRYRGLVMDEATHLAVECNGGDDFQELRRKSSSQSPLAVVSVQPDSKVAFRDAALRLRAGECAKVDGPVSEYVVKRLE
ncbi:MAG TPA: hypothetical protein VGH20_01015 [Myxococcales bacterium]|jgi:hypothetical protein